MVERHSYRIDVTYELDDVDGRIGRIMIGGVDIEQFPSDVQADVREELETINLMEWSE